LSGIELLVGLAGESHHDIGADLRPRPHLPHPVHEGAELRGRVPAAHLRQHFVITGLQRQMEVVAQGRMIGHLRQQRLIHIHRLQGTQPQPQR